MTTKNGVHGTNFLLSFGYFMTTGKLPCNVFHFVPKDFFRNTKANKMCTMFHFILFPARFFPYWRLIENYDDIWAREHAVWNYIQIWANEFCRHNFVCLWLHTLPIRFAYRWKKWVVLNDVMLSCALFLFPVSFHLGHGWALGVVHCRIWSR